MKNAYTIYEFFKDAENLVEKTKGLNIFNWNIAEVCQKDNLFLVITNNLEYIRLEVLKIISI